MQPSWHPSIVAGLVGVMTSAWLSRHFIPVQQRAPLESPSRPFSFSHPLIGLNPVPRANTSAPEDFDWYSLQPSENLTWTDCYDGHKCARLSLPLDYFTPEGPKTHIALQMLPAADRDNYKGSILFNPGGPGFAGTNLVKNVGAALAGVVGPEFDILGFDIRGTGATTPLAQCFESEMQFLQFSAEALTLLINASDHTLPLARNRERLISQRCVEIIGGKGKENLNGTVEEWGPGRFMSTPSIATDMLRIIEQLGQDKLQFWGFSYGSVLGQYFAAMYPDRVGRLIIDGVFDAEEYSRGLWDGNLADMDPVIKSFYTFCHQAGPEKCPLYESTAEGVEERVNRILASVENSPLPVPFLKPLPSLITRGLLQRLFFNAASSPLDSYKTLADQFYAVETNNQTAIHTFFGVATSAAADCSQDQSKPWKAPNQSLQATAFGDSGILEEQPGDAEKLLARLYNDSAIAAPFWAPLRLQSWEWKIEAKWRYTGPFSANTSHPILIAQPTYDPRCPIEQSRRVQKRYAGAGFLEQRSYGHCTLAAPSACTYKHVRAYFVNGTLPEEGVVCEPDALPFIGAVGSKGSE